MKKTLFYILICCLSSCQLFAQSNNIRFDKITISQGLSQSSINTILQDHKGFMWFGTQDGLNMFDGYKFTVFKNDITNEQSIVDNYITALYEDPSHNIWIGTLNGLSVYNRKLGIFFSYLHSTKNSQSLSNNNIRTIYEDQQKNIWIGTINGLNKVVVDSMYPTYRLKFANYYSNGQKNSLSSSAITSIYEDLRQNLWIGTVGGGLNRFNREKNTFSYYDFLENSYKQDEISNSIYSISEDGEKKLWITSNEGLFFYDREKKKFSKQLFPQLGDQKVVFRFLLQDKNKTYWLVTKDRGVFKWDARTGKLINYSASDKNQYAISDNLTNCIYEDHTGTLWIGTDNGINKFDLVKQIFNSYPSFLSYNKKARSNNVWGIYEDGNNIWLSSDDGIYKYDRYTDSYTLFENNQLSKKSSKNTYRIKPYNTYSLIVGTSYGTYLFNKYNGSFQKLASKNKKSDSLNTTDVTNFYRDFDQNLWLSSQSSLVCLDKNKTEFRLMRYDIYDSDQKLIDKNAPIRNVNDIYQTKDSTLWIATDGKGLYRIIKKGATHVAIKYVYKVSCSNCPSNNSFMCMYEDKNNNLWLATFGGGLNKFDVKNDRFEFFTEKNGLSNNAIYGMVADNTNNLWLSTNKGISKFNITAQSFNNYYATDGLQGDEFNVGAYHMGASGEVYFGGINGVSSFKPATIKYNNYPPTIAITDFLLFNKSVKIGDDSPLQQNISVSSSIQLSYKDNVIAFEYAALHYSSPEKNLYAYMLEGLDEDWNYVGTRRIASFTKLDPGVYVFKVKACNSDGIWSNNPTTIRIVITPPFWKTWWFRMLAFFFLIIVIYLYYRYRIQSMIKYKNRLESLVVQRTSEIQEKNEVLRSQSKLLEAEKEKVENLLLNILPQETVDELKTKGKASARHYRTASVMFTDFKGFTQISEKLRPQDLVRELDAYFIKFDEIIAKFQLEKIKTIGDAYMCAGGLPIRNKSNPVDIVLAGLAIQRYMQSLKEDRLAKGEEFWELRVGIHTGELIAGVVGIKRFAYDVWGDTVNVAQRMETAGEVGKVNISGVTYAIAKEFFVCTYRGKVQAKNKGFIDMYYVEQIRPEFSIDGLGIEPNEAFKDRVEHLLYSKINYKKAEQFIIKMLQDNLPEGLFYHGLHHTLDVCNAAEQLALLEGVEGEDLHVLKTAALFHDSGFTKVYEKNEPYGCELAKEILPQFGYSDKQIHLVELLIMATQVPQRASTLLEKLICDADLDYLGRDDFETIANNLKRELYSFDKIKNDKQWDEIQVSFLQQHKYFTPAAIKLRQAKKDQNLEVVKQRLASYTERI